MSRRRIDEMVPRIDEAAAETSPAPAPPSGAAAVQELQRTAGNAAVMRMLSSAGLMRQAVCSPADQAKLDELMRTTYTREDFHPSTGAGLFDAIYAPGDGNLTITVGISFNFVNGNPADADWVAAVGGPANAATYAPEQFNWTPDEIAKWKQNALIAVMSVWNHRYTFFTQKDCWADTLPPVDVNIEIVERPATGEGKAHFVTTVNKWPTEPGDKRDTVMYPTARQDQQTAHFEESAADGIENPDQSHFVRGTNARAAYGQVDTDNPTPIQFPQNGTTPSAADVARLHTFGATLGRADMPPFPITITGHASSEGDEALNMRISEERARNVSNEIVNGGATHMPTVTPVGEAGAAPTADWRRADITVGAFEANQTTVAHEFGHMFGLQDEYPTPDGGTRDVGTPVAHSALAERLIPGQQPILAHHNEDIMSNGEVVRPHHYVTFLEVLGVMTGTEGTWDVRPANPVGDFPEPAHDGTAIA